ncbi:MAG: YbjQ family protein [Acidimicrobiales bacterium]
MTNQQPQYQRVSPGALPESIPVTTAFDFPEWKVERYVGSCYGLVVRSMGAIKGIGASFKALAGGEVTQYTELLEDSRRHAIDRMIENARILGGNAIIGMRFDSSEIGQSLTEIVAYGTAVIVVGP